MSTNPPDTRIFSGDWLETTDPSCPHRYREGYAGTPAGTWNGWQVFTATPQVMDAIIDSHHTAALHMITAEVAGGAHLDEAWLHALQHLASISRLGDLVVVDTRVLQSDPTQVEILAPDTDGRYRVGFGWMWNTVDPADVHTVHGTIAADGPPPP
ncbi:hypothetical protein V6V47_13635 [Micromonospora sp. CPCC 205539]|uniref:hypothetical protein n=1 Tax=Micromonospora sp. CPCC 205539 TaxID=3122408 RepID=UPI002FEFA466